MKNRSSLILSAIILISMSSLSPVTKLVSTKTHIKFYSTTPAEDILSNNYKAVSTIDASTGDVVFSVPMQSFEFEKALMQKHFNSKDFLNTKANPKAKLVGKIKNLEEINFEKDGTYTALITGDLTINGITKPINEEGTLTVTGQIVEVSSVFNVTLADYGISFAKGLPSTNISKTVEVTVYASYQPQ